MVKKQNYLVCQNLGASEAALRLLGRLAKFWQSANISQGFEIWGGTYFTLLVSRFITYTNKMGSSATQTKVPIFFTKFPQVVRSLRNTKFSSRIL